MLGYYILLNVFSYLSLIIKKTKISKLKKLKFIIFL
jgi:hypothetical protein